MKFVVCRADWQDLTDKLERIAKALETIAGNTSDAKAASDLAQDVRARTNDLASAIPKQPT